MVRGPTNGVRQRLSGKTAVYFVKKEKETEMKKGKLTIMFLVVLGCSLILAGCDGGEKEKDEAIAEAAEARANLAKAQVALAKTEKEKDNLKSELAAVTQAQEELQYQVTELTVERDAAIAKAKDAQAIVEGLREQLREKTEEIRELEEWNKELQATIQELQGRSEQIDEQMGEELYEEPNEESNEGIADGNNV